MYSLETILFACLATAVVGLLAGYIFSQRKGASGLAQRKLEIQLSELQRQQHDYKNEVTEHFQETAQLLNQLTSSYRDVHNHLAQGAHLLAGEAVGESLQTLPETPNKNQPLEAAAITPPLDYAPKSTPYDTGMLNEEFGFEKTPDSVVKSKKKTG